MKAVMLVGGFGTRLRPLTETIKKELLPLVDRPILDHEMDHLLRHGIDEVVMSSPYLEEAFHPFIAARHGEPTITWITESEPLGTGGAIVNALPAVGDEPFFALNGDILTDIDLTAMLAFHRERDAAVTIALHHVEDARAFGLVATDADGRVEEFREKPEDLMPGDVNAGTYLLDPAVLRELDPRPCDLDRAGDLPRRDRGGARRVRLPGELLLDGSGHAREVSAGPLRPPGGTDARRGRTRPRGSRRPRTSSRERSSGAAAASAPRRASAPAPRWRTA